MQSDHTPELDAALAKAQAEFPAIERTKTVKVKTKAGGEYSFDYTPLDDLIALTKPVLAKHDLCVRQLISCDADFVTVRTRLCHASGQFDEVEAKWPRPADIKEMGGVSTYLRRYQYSGILNLASETDDDATGASGDEGTVTDRSKPECPECGAASIIKGKEEYGGGYVCYQKIGGCGKKWQCDSWPPPEPEKPKSRPKSPAKPPQEPDPANDHRTSASTYAEIFAKIAGTPTMTIEQKKGSVQKLNHLADAGELSAEQASQLIDIIGKKPEPQGATA